MNCVKKQPFYPCQSSPNLEWPLISMAKTNKVLPIKKPLLLSGLIIMLLNLI
jgi:hypothetical protein